MTTKVPINYMIAGSGTPAASQGSKLTYVAANNAIELLPSTDPVFSQGDVSTYTLLANVTSVNEGPESIKFTFYSNNNSAFSTGTALYYSLQSSSSPTFDGDDVGVKTSATFPISPDGIGSFVVPVLADENEGEGPETFQAYVSAEGSYPAGMFLANSVSVTINDTSPGAYANGNVWFSSTGINYWIVPDGVTEVSVVAVGGGGGGGTGDGPGYSYPRAPAYSPFAPEESSAFSSGHDVGCGGNGGDLVYANRLPVTAGETITVVVGTGGNGAGSPSPYGGGYPGSNTEIKYANNAVLVRAPGGVGGRVDNISRYNSYSVTVNDANTSNPVYIAPFAKGPSATGRGGRGESGRTDDGYVIQKDTSSPTGWPFTAASQIRTGGGGGAGGYGTDGGQGGGWCGSGDHVPSSNSGWWGVATGNGGQGGHGGKATVNNPWPFPASLSRGGDGGGVGLAGNSALTVGAAQSHSGDGANGSPHPADPGPGAYGGGGGGGGAGVIWIYNSPGGTYPNGYVRQVTASGSGGQQGGAYIIWGNPAIVEIS